eukprot:COSAG06_NODE_3644_length_5081_cov_22.663990_4_plen_168_part_00
MWTTAASVSQPDGSVGESSRSCQARAFHFSANSLSKQPRSTMYCVDRQKQAQPADSSTPQCGPRHAGLRQQQIERGVARGGRQTHAMLDKVLDLLVAQRCHCLAGRQAPARGQAQPGAAQPLAPVTYCQWRGGRALKFLAGPPAAHIQCAQVWPRKSEYIAPAGGAL